MSKLIKMKEELEQLPQGAKRSCWEEMQEYTAKKKEEAKDQKAKDNQ